jgi:hypothetical protein
MNYASLPQPPNIPAKFTPPLPPFMSQRRNLHANPCLLVIETTVRGAGDEMGRV